MNYAFLFAVKHLFHVTAATVITGSSRAAAAVTTCSIGPAAEATRIALTKLWVLWVSILRGHILLNISLPVCYTYDGCTVHLSISNIVLRLLSVLSLIIYTHNSALKFAHLLLSGSSLKV